MNEAVPHDSSFRITESAAKRIGALLNGDDDERMFRVSVSGGGCSGFQYGFSFDAMIDEDEDTVFAQNGVRVVVDSVSLPFLSGARLDFVEELIGSYFKIENPNATATCGCGSSFSV